MKKIFTIALWEFVEKVKTKSFIISIFLTPLIIISFALLPTLLAGDEEAGIKAIGIIDTSKTYIRMIASELEKYKLKDNQPNYLIVNLTEENKSIHELKENADKQITEQTLFGCLILTHEIHDSITVEFRSKSIPGLKDLRRIEEAVNTAIINKKLQKVGIEPSEAILFTKKIEVNSIRLDKEGKESGSDFLVVFFSALILIMLLLMIIISSGGMLIRSLVEEKSNRLIEILVSSCKPDELLAGKIIGLSILGLFQMFIWALVAIALAGSHIIPDEAFSNILPMLIYFLLGFLFYTSIFVGLGSIVTTEQEAQQITAYLSLIILLPVIFIIGAIEAPDSNYVKILSYIPLTLPSIMIIRFKVAPVPIEEIVVTILIMIFSIYLTIIVSAKIFRIGILSYGKLPSLKELILWLKEK
jgi:ABC-2 type transport system permease protein